MRAVLRTQTLHGVGAILSPPPPTPPLFLHRPASLPRLSFPTAIHRLRPSSVTFPHYHRVSFIPIIKGQVSHCTVDDVAQAFLSVSMTQLCIIRTLFSRRSTTRERVIQIVKEWLPSPAIMQAISNRLGYPVQRLQGWVIVKGRHRSEDREPYSSRIPTR